MNKKQCKVAEVYIQEVSRIVKVMCKQIGVDVPTKEQVEMVIVSVSTLDKELKNVS